MQVAHAMAWHPSPQRKVWDPDYTPTTYVVGWREVGIVKVGYTTARRRWRAMVGRGAEVISLTFTENGDPHAARIETWLHSEIGARWPRAFTNGGDAWPYLGSGGGYLECYRIPAGAWPTLPTGLEF